MVTIVAIYGWLLAVNLVAHRTRTLPRAVTRTGVLLAARPAHRAGARRGRVRPARHRRPAGDLARLRPRRGRLAGAAALRPAARRPGVLPVPDRPPVPRRPNRSRSSIMTDDDLLEGPDRAATRRRSLGPAVPRHRHHRPGGVRAGLHPIIAISTLGEPPFTATAEQAHAFLLNASVGWAQAGGGGLWRWPPSAWSGSWSGLTLLLARAEGSPPWRRSVAAGLRRAAAGVPAARRQLGRGRLPRGGDRAGTGPLRLRRRATSASPTPGWRWAASPWPAAGSCSAPGCSAAGWAGGRSSPGVGLVLARFVWTSEVWFAPYFLFWIWVVVVSVQLIRGRVRWGGQP